MWGIRPKDRMECAECNLKLNDKKKGFLAVTQNARSSVLPSFMPR